MKIIQKSVPTTNANVSHFFTPWLMRIIPKSAQDLLFSAWTLFYKILAVTPIQFFSFTFQLQFDELFICCNLRSDPRNMQMCPIFSHHGLWGLSPNLLRTCSSVHERYSTRYWQSHQCKDRRCPWEYGWETLSFCMQVSSC